MATPPLPPAAPGDAPGFGSYGQAASAPPPAAPPGGYGVGAGRGASWWGDAWRLFKRSPLIFIVDTILFVVAMVLLSIVPVIGQIAATLLAPVFTAGIAIGCREVARGGALTVEHLVAGFGERVSSLVLVGLFYLIGEIAIVVVCAALAFALMGSAFLGLISEGGGASIPDLWGAGLDVLLIVLIALALALPLMMAYWFAPALVVFRGDAPLDAMKNSLVACLRNFVPFLVYGLVLIGLAIVASIPLGLGWFVLVPMIFASIYTGYADIWRDILPPPA